MDETISISLPSGSFWCCCGSCCEGIAAATTINPLPPIYLLGGAARASVRKCWSWSSLLGWLLQGLLPPYGWPRPCSLPRGDSCLDQSNESEYTALHVTPPLSPARLHRCCFRKFLKMRTMVGRWKRSRVTRTMQSCSFDFINFYTTSFLSWY